jgi:hypothetical protein
MSMKNRPSRRNHTVQRELLRRFADEHDQIMRVPLEEGVGRTIGTRHATVITNFYNEPLSDGTIDDSFETSQELHAIEGPLGPTLRELLDERRWPIPAERRQQLARWIGLQMVRTPAMRSFPDDLRDTLLRRRAGIWSAAELGRYLEERGRYFGPAELADLWETYTDTRGATTDGDPVLHKGMIRQFEPGFTATVLARGWTFVDCGGRGLVTTDHPVAVRLRTKPDADGQLWGIPGEIVLSLDRHVGLVIGEDPHEDQWIQATDQLAWRINQAIVEHARKEILHHPADEPLKGLTLPRPHRGGVRVPV